MSISVLANDGQVKDHLTPLRKRIAAVDAAIDREVYALYGLTEKEIETVGGR
jgi:hypothetical protein